MVELPETRESLLLKLRDPADLPAWERFVAVYRPAVYRFARRCGLQHADSDDLAQQVVAAVLRVIGEWEKDHQRGTFRSWLLRVARNEVINAVTRGRRAAGRGGTSMLQQLQRQPADDDDLQRLVDDEHRRAVFRWAAQEVEQDFQPATWNAFWLTAIEGRTIEQAAAELGKSVGSVYAARSRVMRRLQQKVRQLESE